MTENATNAKSEALEPHELSSEELDRVSGGFGGLGGIMGVGMINEIMQMVQQQVQGQQKGG
jgi:hypothetical protein